MDKKIEKKHERYSICNSGITLISLVVTIIVLLLLAGISVSMLTGENGILKKTATAKQATEEATELELIKLAVTAARTAGDGKITEENLNNELRANFDDDDIDINLKSISDYWKYKGYKIDNIGNVEKYDKLLPAEYQQVEYIESTGTQFIDTQIYPADNIQIKISLVFCEPSEQCKGAVCSNWSNGGFLLEQRDNGLKWHGKKIHQKINFLKSDVKYNLTLSSSDFYINDEEISSGSSTYSLINKPMRIFGGNNQNCKMKLYEFRIYDLNYDLNNEIILNELIPCYSTTTVIDVNGKQCPQGTIGVYDTVEGKFYTNQGSGTFLNGNDI